MSRVKVGDLINHTCTLQGEFRGVVRLLLASQFVYVTEEGHSRFCLHSEKHEIVKSGMEIPEGIASVGSDQPSAAVARKAKPRRPKQEEYSSAYDAPIKPADEGLVEIDMAALVNEAMAEESQPVEKPAPMPGESMLQYMKRIKGLTK